MKMRFAHGARDTGGSNLAVYAIRFEPVKGSPYGFGAVRASRRRVATTARRSFTKAAGIIPA